MKNQFLLGIDVGTTGARAMAFGLDGAVLAQAYREYGCIYPKPGWVEQDPLLLRDTVFACCKEALADMDPKEALGLAVSAQRSCAILLDSADAPLKLISWLDNRADEETGEIGRTVGTERFYEITGLPLSATWILPKLLHTRKHDPALWAKTAKVIQLQDYIARALGAEDFFSDEPEACFYGLWDNRTGEWSEELLSAFHLDRALFPAVRPAGSMAGRVSEYAAERSGLAAGTPICVGLGDQNSAALGAGVMAPGQLSISLGTGGLATVPLPSCWRDPLCQTMVTRHAAPGVWTYEGLQNAAAGAFRWFRDEIAALEKSRDGDKTYDTLNAMIASVPPGAEGLMMLPWFAGSAAPRWDSAARGGFLGLTLAHDRSAMARACVEGITLEQKDIITSIQKSGVTLERARIIGGATKSEVWNQIQADVYGLPCETLAVTEAAALGAAIAAGVGTGTFSSLAQAAEAMVRVERRYEPIPAHTATYQTLYEIYCDTYAALKERDIFARLAKQ